MIEQKDFTEEVFAQRIERLFSAPADLEAAAAAAKAQGVIPDQSIGLMSYILGYREETANVQEARIEEMDEE